MANVPDNSAADPTDTELNDALRVAGLNLRSLFDRFPFAVQVFAPDGLPRYVNPAHRALWGYDQSDRPRPEQRVLESEGLAAMGLMPLIRRGFQGESVMLPPARYTIEQVPTLPGGRDRWVRTFLYPVADEAGALRAVVVMHIDITEREESKQLLEERVAERTRELSAMLEVSRSAASTLDLHELVGLILDELKSVADYSGATVVVAEESHFRIVEDRGGVAPDRSNPELVGVRWPLGTGAAIWERLRRQQPVIIADVRDDSDLARAFRTVTSRSGDSPGVSHVRSWLAVPLVTADRVVGFVGISKDVPGFYTTQHARLAGAIATHVAAAIENARLFDEERRTGRELATLLEISRSVSSTLEVEPLLGLVLDHLKLVMDYGSAVILTAEAGDERITMREYRGPLPREWVLARPIAPFDPASEFFAALERGEVFIIPDIWAETAAARAYRAQMGEEYLRTAASYIRCLLAAPLFWKGENAGVLVLTHPTPSFYTERHAALAIAVAGQAAVAIENARLFEQERQTSGELAALVDVSRTVSSTLELEPLLRLILDQIKLVIDYVSASIVTLEEDRMVAREYRGPLPREVVLFRRPPEPMDEQTLTLLARGEAYVVPDIWEETPEARAFRAQRGEEYLRTTASYLRCLLVAPMVSSGTVVGALFLTHSQPGFYTEHHAALAAAIAGQAAVALENARLYAAQRQTSAELASLLEVSRNLTSTLELEPLLDAILDQMKVVADYGGASIAIQEGDGVRELRRRVPVAADQRTDVDGAIARGWARLAMRRRPLILADLQSDEPAARAFREAIGAPLEATWLHQMRSWMAVPLLLRDRVLGTIILAHGDLNAYTPHQAELAMALAAQAAAAIENAQLFGQAQRLAALEERQRLARELHDSVSQVLFSIGLGARTARTLLERGSPDRAAPSVEYIANLAEMGMAEMRALLFELRPESLEQEGLVAALAKQAAALRARHSIEVETDLAEEPAIGLDAKEALYRIAQEAMHNTVKHARASRVSLRLGTNAAGVSLEVRDNGLGFDPGGDFPGHLGLRSMRERAERLGGGLTVESAPDQGVVIRVALPA